MHGRSTAMIRRLRPRWMGTVFVILAAIMAACGSSVESPPATAEPAKQSSTPTPTSPKERATWRHGTASYKANSGFLFMAQEKGFDQEEGLDVEYVVAEDTTTLLKALVSGDLDSMENSPGSAFVAMAKGAPIKIVGATLPSLSHQVYVRSEIDSIEDLRGKVIGAGLPGSLPNILWDGILRNHGMTTDEVEMVNIGGSGAQFQALVAGKVDAIAAAADFVLQAQDDEDIKVLEPVVKELPDYLYTVIMTRDDVIQERPEELHAFLRSQARGLRYALTHRDETIQLAAKKTETDPENPMLSFVYDQYVNDGLTSPNLTVSEESVKYTQELNVSAGSQETVLPYEQVVDSNFQQQILKELGPFQP